MNVSVIKYPTDTDLLWCKQCTLNTIGKTTTKQPTEEWIHSLLVAGHSPIRELWFGIKMEIPYWVSVHFVRHHIGVNHYVETQRTDRTGIERDNLPQGALVSHIMSINAQELIFMAHKRLCNQASKETRQVMQEICKQVINVAPYMKDLLVPECEFRGKICPEINSCGRYDKI